MTLGEGLPISEVGDCPFKTWRWAVKLPSLYMYICHNAKGWKATEAEINLDVRPASRTRPFSIGHKVHNTVRPIGCTRNWLSTIYCYNFAKGWKATEEGASYDCLTLPMMFPGGDMMSISCRQQHHKQLPTQRYGRYSWSNGCQLLSVMFIVNGRMFPQHCRVMQSVSVSEQWDIVKMKTARVIIFSCFLRSSGCIFVRLHTRCAGKVTYIVQTGCTGALSVFSIFGGNVWSVLVEEAWVYISRPGKTPLPPPLRHGNNNSQHILDTYVSS